MIDERDYERTAQRFTMPEPAFDRLLGRRDRKRKVQRISAAVVGAAVFVAAIAFVAVEREPRPPVVPGGGPTGVEHPAVGRIGIEGFPPEGATPSTPLRGVPVLSFLWGHTGGDPGRFSLTLYEDGRVIWERLGNVATADISTGLIEQRLTPEGIELVRSEVLANAPFVGEDAHFLSGSGLIFGDLTVWQGDRRLRITWGDIGPDREATSVTPTPGQASALVRLDGRLEDLGSWLPASAWEDAELRPYIASRYSVCFERQTPAGSDPVGLPDVLALLPHPVVDFIAGWDLSHQHFEWLNGPGSIVGDLWCASVTTDDARHLGAILEDAGYRGTEDVFGASYENPARSLGAPAVGISMAPLSPDQP